MRSSHSLDRIDTALDDEHLVADAGLVLPATLVQHLGLRELVDEHLERRWQRVWTSIRVWDPSSVVS